MYADDAFREIFEDADSGESDFEEVLAGDEIDGDSDHGDVYVSESESDNEVVDPAPAPGNNGPRAGGNGQQVRPRRVQGGGDVAFRAALPRAYQHDWLMDFNQPHGQMIFAEDGVIGEDDISEYAIFSHFFDLLVTETNRYAATTIASKGGVDGLRRHSRLRKWRDVDAGEMKAFLAILLLMGMDRRPNYDAYWTTEWTIQTPGIRAILSRDRFYLILQVFHTTDNALLTQAGDPNHDHQGKIKEVMDMLVSRWQSAYYPGREIAVDETIIPFKGRSSMKVYKPNKPHKWGLNCWNIAESNTGYIWNSELYQGKTNNETEVGLYKNVVLRLSQPFNGKGHHIYMDNLFSSPELYFSLAENGIGACGTLRVNRVDTPNEIKETKTKKGDPLCAVRDGDLLFLSWFDKRQVNVVTSVHNQSTFQKDVRARGQQDPRKVDKPVAIECYTRFMGGVDRADQGMWYYLNIHKTLKWWKKVFVYLLEVSYVNSWIIWKRLHPATRLKPEKFRYAVIHGLLEGHVPPDVRPGRRSIDQPLRLTERHFLKHITAVTAAGRKSRPDCVVSSNRSVKRHQIEYACEECNLPMCPVPCFRRYHTLVDYKANCEPGYH
ncbi:piggyBac transposable element-derived protein 4-like [Patiria miniata]|uniref:PiggyBac transposable element-derived protein domain-containing protein n=1 Tax=Patiria miniata TaxID=46514 RepID=A0A914AQI7_PATMI|nr:piggyBac transposable element-derived protein 4-like [Patiria miniata]